MRQAFFKIDCRIALHDPCIYGRYLELSDVPARVLSDMGIECGVVVIFSHLFYMIQKITRSFLIIKHCGA